jgi:hypothetical protein
VLVLKHETEKVLMVEKREYTKNGGFLYKMIVFDKEDGQITLMRGGCGWSMIDPKTGVGTGMDWVRVIAEGPIEEKESMCKKLKMIETPEQFDVTYSILYEQLKQSKR